jgi:hypothetical protein
MELSIIVKSYQLMLNHKSWNYQLLLNHGTFQLMLNPIRKY